MDEKKESLTAEFEEFCSTTSAHGFHYLATPSRTKRTVWIIILVFALGFGMVHLYLLITEYLKYEYHDSIVINNIEQPVFPDLTICDNTGFSDSSLESFDGSIAMLGRLLVLFKRVFFDPATPASEKGSLAERLSALTSVFYSNLDQDQRSAVGVKFDGLVLSCTYKGSPCTQEDFKHYIHPLLINCYTFQPKPANGSGSENLLLGPQNGLSLVLRSEPNPNVMYTKLDNNGNINSIRVAIHARDTIPFIMNKGLNIEPGKSTSISVMMKTTKRLEAPYTECQGKITFSVGSRSFLYTSSVCHEQCIIETIRRKCECTSTNFEDISPSANFEYCLTFHDNDSLSVLNTRSSCEIKLIKFLPDLNCEHCIWDCEESAYDTQVAFADWPHENKIQSFVKAYIDPLPCTNTIKKYMSTLIEKSSIDRNDTLCPKFNVNDTRMPFSVVSMANVLGQNMDRVNALNAFTNPNFKDLYRYTADVPRTYYGISTQSALNTKWVKESFYRLNVYFRESTVEQHIQVASFSLADLWSGVGGILGLWLGISVMTIIETMSFLVNFVTNCFKRKTSTNMINVIRTEDVEPKEKCNLPKVE